MSETQVEYPLVVEDREVDYTVEVEDCVSPLKLRVVRGVKLEWEPDKYGFQLGILYNLARYTPCFFIDRLTRYNSVTKVEVVFHYEPAGTIEDVIFYLPSELDLEDIYRYVEDMFHIANNY